MGYKTLKFRIKDSSVKNRLSKMSYAVNYVWNYCNEMFIKKYEYNGRYLTNFDLHYLTAGCSKELGIPAQSIQSVCSEYSNKRKIAKKIKLSWRSRNKSQGWIPFKKTTIDIFEFGKLRFHGKVYKFWQTSEIVDIVSGSFNQDAKGRWYVNVVVEDKEVDKVITGDEVGVDLGLKTVATYSDGAKFDPVSATRLYAQKLATAQRARKKGQVSSIQTKIKNTRRDALQKETTRVIQAYDKIFIGNVSSKKLIKTKMAKSVLDVGWGLYRSLLESKAKRLGKSVVTVNENRSSTTCSGCLNRTGPKGLRGLEIREWACECGAIHDRDVNAAKNILRLGLQTPKGESLPSRARKSRKNKGELKRFKTTQNG